MSLRTISAYAGEIKPLLPARAFEPARSRLLWLPLHLGLIALMTTAIARDWVPPWLFPLLSLLIGGSYAGLVFLGHETLHGAVVRGRRLRHVVGWVGFLPFAVSPRLWVAWHNKVHHGNAQHAERDPDAYPTLHAYRGSLALRRVTDWLGIGRGRLRGWFSLLVGFSVQSVHMLLVAQQRKYLSRSQARLAMLETLLGAAVFVALFVALGPFAFLFACAVPVIVANAIVMAHILTNHSLSPLTDVNDPLANSLTVTVPRWAEFLTMGFGFHVEHHLFPWMSSRHGPLVRDLVVARYPGQYQSMPLLRAIREVYRTPRVYEDAHTLFDPHTGRRVPTLGPVPAKLAAGVEATQSPNSRRSVPAPTALRPSLPPAA